MRLVNTSIKNLLPQDSSPARCLHVDLRRHTVCDGDDSGTSSIRSERDDAEVRHEQTLGKVTSEVGGPEVLLMSAGNELTSMFLVEVLR